MSKADVQVRITTKHNQRYLADHEFPSNADMRELNTEYWKPIASCPGYSVSSYGRVRNEMRDRDLKPYPSGHTGKLQVRLGGVDCQIHRLVAEAFDPYYDPAFRYRHIDGDKSNNAAHNIERDYGFASPRRGGRTRH